ncbi:hypothetical protein CRG98_001379 [Punica granatum]|uniref:Uncharacterized protein n=1 Tax=Punica granatum TaxID=22663 RepID=A0A2I0LC05_PUNGR|nr:hypothetical protein CRG98_001379 [Punica granatum]
MVVATLYLGHCLPESSQLCSRSRSLPFPVSISCLQFVGLGDSQPATARSSSSWMVAVTGRHGGARGSGERRRRWLEFRGKGQESGWEEEVDSTRVYLGSQPIRFRPDPDQSLPIRSVLG